jgi:hypothetical protein
MRYMLIAGLLMSINLHAGKRIQSDDEQKKEIKKHAIELTSDLQSRISLTNMQCSAIQKILIDYLTNVSIIEFTQRAGAREKTYDVKSDPPSDLQDLNISYDDNSLEELRNADNDANSKLDNIIMDAQRGKWTSLKDSWWSKVIAAQYEDN